MKQTHETGDREFAVCDRCGTRVVIFKGNWSESGLWLCEDCLAEEESCGCSD